MLCPCARQASSIQAYPCKATLRSPQGSVETFPPCPYSEPIPSAPAYPLFGALTGSSPTRVEVFQVETPFRSPTRSYPVHPFNIPPAERPNTSPYRLIIFKPNPSPHPRLPPFKVYVLPLHPSSNPTQETTRPIIHIHIHKRFTEKSTLQPTRDRLPLEDKSQPDPHQENPGAIVFRGSLRWAWYLRASVVRLIGVWELH